MVRKYIFFCIFCFSNRLLCVFFAVSEKTTSQIVFWVIESQINSIFTKFFHIQIFLSSYKHYFLFCLEIWDKVVRVQKQQEEILSDAVSVTLTYKNRNTHSSKYIQALYCVIQFELPNILQLFTCYQCFCLKWKSKLVSWHLCTWVHILARCKIRTNKYIYHCIIQK